MSRMFSIVKVGEYSEMCRGFVTSAELMQLEGFADEVLRNKEPEGLKVEVMYLAFMDHADAPVEPATEEELGILYENLEEFVEEGYIELVEEMEITLDSPDNIIVEDVNL